MSKTKHYDQQLTPYGIAEEILKMRFEDVVELTSWIENNRTVNPTTGLNASPSERRVSANIIVSAMIEVVACHEDKEEPNE